MKFLPPGDKGYPHYLIVDITKCTSDMRVMLYNYYYYLFEKLLQSNDTTQLVQLMSS
jgi:hypothetical protein